MQRRIRLRKALVIALGLSFLLSNQVVGPGEMPIGVGEWTVQASLSEEPLWEGSLEQKVFSEFNHHLGGLFVVFLGALSLLEAAGRLRKWWAISLWPLGLLVLGLYMVIRSDGYAWPLGPRGFLESLSNPEVLQHKTFAVIMIALGMIELLRRWHVLYSVVWLFLFYLIMIVPGVLLMAHSSVMSAHHHSHHLYSQHLIMGTLALLAAGSRFLHESGLWRWRYSAFVWPSIVLVLGLQLLLYSE